MVFFPVALTWWALHRATAAYQRLLASGLKEGGTSFLQLWTTGFGDKLEQHFRLSNVALSATIIIAAGVALIALERFLSRSADRADDDEYRDCASRLARTLNYASLTINSGNIEASAQALELIGESVAQLLDAHRHTRDADDVAYGRRAHANTRVNNRGGQLFHKAIRLRIQRRDRPWEKPASLTAENLHSSCGGFDLGLRRASPPRERTRRPRGSLRTNSDDASEIVRQHMRRVAATAPIPQSSDSAINCGCGRV